MSESFRTCIHIRDIKNTKEALTSQNRERKINFKIVLYYTAALEQCISGNISI